MQLAHLPSLQSLELCALNEDAPLRVPDFEACFTLPHRRGAARCAPCLLPAAGWLRVCATPFATWLSMLLLPRPAAFDTCC